MCNAAPARAASPRGMADCPEIKGLVGRACSPAPAEADATATATSTAAAAAAAAGYPWDGGAVWAGRTRRKPIHGGSMAPSMAPTVLPTHTAPPLTGSRGCWQVSTLVDTSVRYRYIKWGQIRFPQENGSDPKRRSGRSQETVEGGVNLSKAGWVRLENSVEGGVGPVAGVSAAWMPRPSPHGWVYGVPHNLAHPASPQETSFCRCSGCCFGLCGFRAPPGRLQSRSC